MKIKEFKERFDNLWYNFNSLSEKTLLGLKNGMFFIIVVDLFGIYYYLQLKTLGTAILIISMAITAIILWRLRDFEPIEKDKPGKKDKPENPDDYGDFSIGIDSEKYNKRLEKAMGTI